MEIKKLKIKELPQPTKEVITSLITKQKPPKPTIDPEDLPSEKEIVEDTTLVKVHNKWSKPSNNNLRIRELVYFRGADLAHLNTLRSNEQKEILKINYKGTKYILRKTTLDIVRAVMNIYSKIKNQVEKIIGYLVTVSGTIYLLSKIKAKFFSFNSNYLDENSKLKILERTIEHLVELNRKNLLLRDLSPNNIFYSGKEVFLGDLRSLRMSLNPSTILASLKSFLNQLIRSGTITKEEATYLLTYYMGGNSEVCLAWYKSKNNEEVDEVEILEALEEEFTRVPLL